MTLHNTNNSRWVNLWILFICFSGSLHAQLNEKPETPSINRDVHTVENLELTRPHLPAVQTTFDGRIGLAPNRGLRGLPFRLFTPEKLDRPFTKSNAGVNNVLDRELSHDVSTRKFHGPNHRGIQHAGLCEPSANEGSSERKNPYVCNENDDCYDFNVIAAARMRNQNGITFFSTPVTARVNNPKTVNAELAEITTGIPIEGLTFPTFNAFFETMTPADGHILVGRIAHSPIQWVDADGNSRSTTSNNVYLVNDNPNAFEPCDVRQFDKVYPLSHAPQDDTINRRYGFALQPFRDGLGELIEDGAELGSYPWIDKGANNISFTPWFTPLFSSTYAGGSQYPTRCPTSVGTCASDNESNRVDATLHGRALMGLWTNGKMIAVDNLVNNIDYGLGVLDRHQREIELYSSATDQGRWLRIAAGRENVIRSLPLGSSGNTNFFDTLEHRFNYIDNMKPVTPSDVPWLLSSGTVTDEFAFDDYLNPDGFIISPMIQAFSFRGRGHQLNRDSAKNFGPFSNLNGVANAATAPNDRWRIPAYGLVVNGRIEPVANGGIHGRGLWLDGERTYLQYDVPANAKITNTPWYVGLFFDQRRSGTTQHLITFPDGTKVHIKANGGFHFLDDKDVIVRDINIPTRARQQNWAHIGLRISAGNRDIETYHNGFLIDRFSASTELFRLSEGELYVGNAPSSNIDGLKGWIGEFKVIAQNVNPEVACNHANGTLAGVTTGGEWRRLANAYPPIGHERINELVAASGQDAHSSYVCYTNYSDDYAAHLGNIPRILVGVRDAINFPEGPLVFNQPRPDSSSNEFCLSCHTTDGLEGLSIQALTFNPLQQAMDDPRRQPTQPDPTIYGNIPANLFGLGLPARDIQTDGNGIPIDQWILPGGASAPGNN